MLRGIKLSAKKLHSIRVVSSRRNPLVFLGVPRKDIVGALSLKEMEAAEKKIFGKRLF